jgi:hypothetical protein
MERVKERMRGTDMKTMTQPDKLCEHRNNSRCMVSEDELAVDEQYNHGKPK